jgi:hypothetical protein
LHPLGLRSGGPMAKHEQRSGRGRRLAERRRAGGAQRAQEKKEGPPRRRLKVERRSGLDRRSMGALDAILSPRDES